MKVAVIAFGTRGDVQPLVILAAEIASSSSWCSENGLVLVTHDAHRTWCTTLAGQIDIVGVDSPPVLWKGTAAFDDAEARANLAQEDGCIKACQGAGLIVFNMFALEGYHISEAFNIPSVVCHPYLTSTAMPCAFPRRMRRVYPRLFRRLKVGATAVAGSTEVDEGAVTRGKHGEEAWSHVEHWMWPLFSDRWGGVRRRLGLRSCPLQNDDPAAESLDVSRNTGARTKDLTLPANGTVDARRGVEHFKLPLVLYLFSPLVVDASPYWPKSVRVCGYLFPPMTTETQATRRHDARGSLTNARTRAVASTKQRRQLDQTPTNASNKPGDAMVGVNEYEASSEERLIEDLPLHVEAFLSAREDRPIFIGFGSMWQMCVPGYPLALALRVLLVAARQMGKRCLMNLPKVPHEEAPAWQNDSKKDMEVANDGRLRELESATEWALGEFGVSRGQEDVYRGPVAHHLLFPRCSLAIHHGGSGTTAAVLRAGIPHVVCPQQMDQFFWAERIQYLAVGSVFERSLFTGLGSRSTSTSPHPPGPLVRKAEAAISSALTPQVKLRAACLGVKVRTENGLAHALDSLNLFVRRQQLDVFQATSPHEGSRATGCVIGATSSSVAHSIASLKEACAEKHETIAANIRHHTDDLTSGGSKASAAGVLKQSRREDYDDGAPRFGLGTSKADLVLREMPNGLRIWWANRAEEEARFIYGEVFDDRTYARMGILVQDGDTVWDVGANVGIASIFFELETDTPDSLDVYAFEPLPLNAKALKRNLSTHCPKAVVLEYALGAQHADGVLATFYPRMPGNSTLRPLEKAYPQRRDGCPAEEMSSSGLNLSASGPAETFFDDAQQVACNVRTVSWAMATLGVHKIDLLKVDVEGAELDVLLGIDDQDWPKIKQVVAEVHPVRDRVARACKLLRDQGFHVSKQALGLDGTPVSPSRKQHTPHRRGGDISSTLTPRATKTYPRDESSARCRLGIPEHHSDNTHVHSAVQRDDVGCRGACPRDDVDVARSANSRAGDNDPADGHNLGQDDYAARDGVVFMVYARRA
ncbi:unnamed protein product [Scytosiphon promiscuus]